MVECQRSLEQPSLFGGLPMKLKPLGDRLSVGGIEEEETTASGIVLPDTAKEKPQKGKVIAVGEGRYDEDGEKRIPLDVAEGDEVLYSKYGGTEIKIDGEELLVLRESDVLAQVESYGEHETDASQGTEVQQRGARGPRGRRRRRRKRRQGHARPARPLRGPGQEVRRPDDHERRCHDRS